MTLVERIHGRYVFDRRVAVLATKIAQLMPGDCRVLDVGCGDGQLARQVQDRVPGLNITGVEVLPRAQTRIPVTSFDGITLPFPDRSFEVVMMVDVLHHTEDPLVLLREAARVASTGVLLKDHLLEGMAAGATLRWMDSVGNARHGVALPYNYWTRKQWQDGFAELGLRVNSWSDRLAIYPPPADWIFGRRLHFLAQLVPTESAA